LGPRLLSLSDTRKQNANQLGHFLLLVVACLAPI
jgi:hypothetical protein